MREEEVSDSLPSLTLCQFSESEWNLNLQFKASHT